MGAWSRGGAWSQEGGVPGPREGVCLVLGGAWSQGGVETATTADGTHPTGMHSCSLAVIGNIKLKSLFSYFRKCMVDTATHIFRS